MSKVIAGTIDLQKTPAGYLPIAPANGFAKVFERPDSRLYNQLAGGLVTLAADINWREPVRAATALNNANITSLSGLQTIDTVVLAAGDRLLVRGQTAAADNGIYVVAAGAWTRAVDATTAASVVKGTKVRVLEGKDFLNHEFTQTQVVTTVGTDAQGWRSVVLLDQAGAFQFPSPMGIGHTFYNFNQKAMQIWDGTNWVSLNGPQICTSTSRPGAVGDSMTIYETDTGLSYVWYNGAWKPLGGGGTGGSTVLGYSQVITNQAGIAGTATPITGLAVTIPALPPGHRVRVTFFGCFTQLTAAGREDMALYDGATMVQSVSQDAVAGGYRVFNESVVLTPTATAAHTYTVLASTTAGTMTLACAAVAPAFLLVEDLDGGGGGPLGTPMDSYVGQATTSTSTATTPQDIAGTTVTVISNGPTDKFLCNVSADIQQNISSGEALTVALMVDGVAQLGQVIIISPSQVNSRHTVGQNYIVTGLSAGGHIFKLQLGQTSTGNQFATNAQHTKLIVVKLSGAQGAQGIPGTPGGAAAVQDEGIAVITPNIINFVGTGVTASSTVAGRVDVTVPGPEAYVPSSSFLNTGWVPYGTGWQDPTIRRDKTHITLNGLVKNNTGAVQANATIGILPVGYRPTAQLLFATLVDEVSARIDILPTGTIVVSAKTVSAGGYVTLDGIHFYTD